MSRPTPPRVATLTVVAVEVDRRATDEAHVVLRGSVSDGAAVGAQLYQDVVVLPRPPLDEDVTELEELVSLAIAASTYALQPGRVELGRTDGDSRIEPLIVVEREDLVRVAREIGRTPTAVPTEVSWTRAPAARLELFLSRLDVTVETQLVGPAATAALEGRWADVLGPGAWGAMPADPDPDFQPGPLPPITGDAASDPLFDGLREEQRPDLAGFHGGGR